MRIALLLIPALALAQSPRTPDGHPDFSGSYDINTLTPVMRPATYGDRKSLTDEEAKAQAQAIAAKVAAANKATDPNRAAPAKGGSRGAGATGPVDIYDAAGGNTGGYNGVWVEFGSQAFKLEGQYRTSIIVDPPNGRMPPMTAEAMKRGGRTGGREGVSPGPYDDPEVRPLSDRCLMSFGQSATTPALPNYFYNNLKQIVQGKDTIVILNEMIHDARIVRMNAKHDPPEIRRWTGDSIGHWEGEVLVVDTTNFKDRPALAGADGNLHVIEKFSRIDPKTLLYQFTIDDPTVWTKSWSGEMPWPATDGRIFEYACHEGNYALANILRGARLQEAEAAKQAAPQK